MIDPGRMQLDRYGEGSHTFRSNSNIHVPSLSTFQATAFSLISKSVCPMAANRASIGLKQLPNRATFTVSEHIILGGFYHS